MLRLGAAGCSVFATYDALPFCMSGADHVPWDRQNVKSDFASQELRSWYHSPGPTPAYPADSLHAPDILETGARLPWEPQLSPAALIQQQMRAHQELRQRCKEEIDICRREAADSARYHQHYESHLELALGAAAAPAAVPLMELSPAATAMWQMRQQAGLQALRTAARDNYSRLLDEAQALLHVLSGASNDAELAAFALGAGARAGAGLGSGTIDGSGSGSSSRLLGAEGAGVTGGPSGAADVGLGDDDEEEEAGRSHAGDPEVDDQLDQLQQLADLFTADDDTVE